MRKFNKISMMVVAAVMFLGAMFLSMEKNENGKWRFGMVKASAQGESGGGAWHRTDNDCVYLFSGKANATLKIFGGTITITLDGSGNGSYTFPGGRTECSSGGTQQCTARYCPPL